MASKGTHISGTDGTDFEHRQRIVSIYQQTGKAKAMLCKTITFHRMLFVLMLLKLTAHVLGGTNISILHHLHTPKPGLWEWLYAASILSGSLARQAMAKNSIGWMRCFHVSLFVFTIAPVVIGGSSSIDHSVPSISMFISISFVLSALSVHLIQLYYSHQLINIWTTSKVTRKVE